MSGKQYEVWLADLNPRFGTETGKTRPVLVVQTDLLNGTHPSTLVCPITSNVKPGVNILRVNLNQGDAGLNKASSIMIDQVRAIDNKRLLKKLGNLPGHLKDKVKDNLRIVMDL
ncbi:type II toxin-antitoxin system PemK/MazF family toxin [Haliscomenobacter hydrossis]|uniref:mRNA interferase n=1 Tax=Haliscomenobacter hydrossis (strain ATCC 27775 / DSM 1100 / LMG 10767 / O) TaxID=760192 RepID=F4KS24_HALH1|nr:type II toxin-antitoxin system PemK/MazF family toxin [Haliscomenobacter hydrossis]AEE51111.1 transcriptional modulator of MazE/toxin, MazF [Haliscomenobacter hydrossis DSM 1100]